MSTHEGLALIWTPSAKTCAGFRERAAIASYPCRQRCWSQQGLPPDADDRAAQRDRGAVRGQGARRLGVKGVVVGQGDTYEAAVADLKSALQFHMETFGADTLKVDPPILEAFIAEAGVPA